MKDEVIKQVDKSKAHFKAGLSEDGESRFIEVSINTHLQQILKKVCIDETETFSEDDEQGNISKMERYKVKRIIYSALTNSRQKYLFIKDFIDSGKYTFDFRDREQSDMFIIDFKQNLFNLLKCYSSLDIEQTITFKINPLNTGD